MIDIFNYVCVSCNKPGVFFQSCALAIWNVARCKTMIYQMLLIIFYDQQCLSVCQMSTIVHPFKRIVPFVVANKDED